jgi:hypothetical protein
MNMKKTGLSKILIIGLALSATLPMTGCSTPELDDGYQLGDVTHIVIREEEKIVQAKQAYCDKAATSVVRDAALLLIRLKYPFIPENGICGKQPGQLQSKLVQGNGNGG